MVLINWKFKLLLDCRDVVYKISTHAKRFLPFFLAVIIFLPSLASPHQTANIKNESLKNKKISYKEIRQRKHSKNKPNPKAQVVTSCQTTALIRPEVLTQAANMIAAVYNSNNDKIYIFGAEPSGQILKYDPVTHTVTVDQATITINSGVYPSAAFSPATGKIYVFASNSAGNNVIEYDPVTFAVTTKSVTLNANKSGSDAIYSSVDSKIYIFGRFGQSANTYLTNYDPATNTSAGNMNPTASNYVIYHTAVAASVFCPANNKIYTIGGLNQTGEVTPNPMQRIAEYNSGTNTSTLKSATLPSGKGALSAVWNPTDSRIYIFGGFLSSSQTGFTTEIYKYDPVGDTITTASETLPSGLAFHKAVYSTVNSKIYLFGGNVSEGSTYGGSVNVASDKIIEYPTSVCSTSSYTLQVSSASLDGSSINTNTGGSFVAYPNSQLTLNITPTSRFENTTFTLSTPLKPSVGAFAQNGPSALPTGTYTFTPTTSNIGNNYAFTVRATDNNNVISSSDLNINVAVRCNADAQCSSTQACIESRCCTTCKYNTNICSTLPNGAANPGCNFNTTIGQNQSPAPQNINNTEASNTISTPTATPSPTPTAVPVVNITPQQGITIPTSPGVNSVPSANTTPKSSAGVIDASIGGIVKPQNTPTLPWIDLSILKNSPPKVKPDPTNSYIDASKGIEVKSEK